VHKKALVDEGWSGIDVQLKRRYDLIPALVATVKGYSVHEKSLLEEVAKLRASALGAHTVAEKVQAEVGLSHTLKTLFAVAENYPTLKANENFLSLQKELSLIETELQLARRYYNGTARIYNTSIASFPALIIARAVQYEAVPYFEIASSDERTPPRIHF
jgi:LemA protein